MSAPLRIGTRGSALALAQAGWVADQLGGELVILTTAGDLDRAAGDKGRWTGTLEHALAQGGIDLAVHSAKDVPGQLPDELPLVSAPLRADARDTLCGPASLDELPRGARIGTSALRRRAQLLAVRPDLDVVELRGNVDTRLRRLQDGLVDALVLARAGLQRLGRPEADGQLLDGDPFIPAAGQGILALQARAGDERVSDAVRAVHDGAAWTALLAERALVRALDADCSSPIGAHAVADADGGLTLTAFVGLPDGTAWICDRLTGSAEDPEALGSEVGARMTTLGAMRILASAAETVPPQRNPAP